MKTSFSHNRIYCAALVMMAPLSILFAGGLFYWQTAVGGPLGHIPEWAIPWMAALDAVYGAAMVITLLARWYRPQSGRRLTRLLNWALLPAFFWGTILGIYGLWKVDRPAKA